MDVLTEIGCCSFVCAAWTPHLLTTLWVEKRCQWLIFFFTQSVMCYKKQRIQIGLAFISSKQNAMISSHTVMHNGLGPQKQQLPKSFFHDLIKDLAREVTSSSVLCLRIALTDIPILVDCGETLCQLHFRVSALHVSTMSRTKKVSQDTWSSSRVMGTLRSSFNRSKAPACRGEERRGEGTEGHLDTF